MAGIPLASAFVRVRPDTDQQSFKRDGEKAGRAAGQAYADGFAKDSAGRLRQANGRFATEQQKAAIAAGGKAGSSYADGFYRDAAGKLRQANGRFATDAQKRMIQGGGSAGRGFGDAFNREGGGTIRKGFNKLKGELGPLLIPLGVGAAVAAIGKIGIEYENNLNILKAVTNATGQEMDIVATKARELGADIDLPGVSAAGAAKAMTELSKAGFTVQQSMDAAKGTLQLARIAAIGEGEAAEIAANAVNAFGIKASDVNKVVDQLAATANSSSVEIKEVSYSFKMAAAVFSGMQGPAIGADEAITELNTAIAILGNNGIKGSDAGTSLKQMLLQLTGPSQQAKDIMQALALNAGGAAVSLELQNDVLHGSKKVRAEAIAQIEKMNPGLKNMGDIAYDANGKMRGLREIIDLVAKGTAGMTQEEKNYAVTQIFGADASRAVLALLKGGLPVYDTMRSKVLQQGSAAKVAAAQNAGLGGAIDNVKGQFENAAIAIYNQVKGPLTTALRGVAVLIAPLAGGIERFGDFVRANGDAIRDWAVAIGVVTLALKINSGILAVQAAGGLLAYVKGIKIVTTTTRVWAGAQALLNATLLVNPVYAIIVGIVALGTALVLAYRRSETFRNVVQAVWGAIKTAIGAVVNWIMNTVWPSLQRAWQQIAAGAMWLYRNAILPAWNAIKVVIDFVVKAVTGYINFWLTVIRGAATVVVWFWKNVISPVFSVIRKIVEIWWLAIQIIFKAFTNYLRNVIVPAVQAVGNFFGRIFGWINKNVIQPWWTAAKAVFALFRQYVIGPLVGAIVTGYNRFRALFSLISGVVRTWWQNNISPIFANVRRGWQVLSDAFRNIWNNRIKPIFTMFIGFIRNNVVGGFNTGVAAIKAAWDKVREYARKPVAFVVNSVINPFIRGLNNAAKIVGVKDRVSEIGGFANGGQIPVYASGGQIPGLPSRRDNTLARVAGTGRPLAVASGEYITNTRSTLANLPLMEAINAKRGKVTRDDVDPYLDGAADGGRVRRGGIGDGFGDFWKRAMAPFTGIGSAISDPIGAAKKIAANLMAKIPGGGQLVSMIKGASTRVINGAVKWLTDFGGGALGGGNGPEGWKAKRAIIARWFPNLRMISGPRPGARTLSGNRSLHADGLAVDYPPVRALAARIRATFGKSTQELITPWNELNLLRGRPHRYTGAVWRQHNFPGGNAHVHWGAAAGGLVGRQSGLPQVPVFDRGGILRPGLNLVRNALGRDEPLMRALPYEGRERTRARDEAARRLQDAIERLRGRAGGGTGGGGSGSGGGAETVRLHPADIDALARMIGREIIAGVGAGNYAAGRRSALYTRGA